MIISPSGVGLQNILSYCKPTFVWDAFRAGRCIGKGSDNTGRLDLTITDNDSRTASQWCRWTDNRIEYMSVDSDDAFGKEILFGPCGEFYGGATTGTQVWSTARLNLAPVSPTTTDCWVDYSGEYPDIIKNPTLAGTDHCERFSIDSDYDGVNDSVVEKSMSRSATYDRHFWIFVKQTGGTDPTGIIELGWNTASGTRTTESPWIRKMPNTDWYMCGIIVPSGIAAGYGSIKVVASNGEWEIACLSLHNIYVEHERIPRIALRGNSNRGKWDVHTTNAELKLKSVGWLAMSIVLPDRSVSNGHTDFAGAGNYDPAGMFNLDCGTYRLRVAMSETYDRLIVSMSTTAAVNFAYLDCPSDWNDFAAMGIVVCWEINKGNKYVALYVNGEKLDSVYNPADWYPDNLVTGTAYIGSTAANGSPAEAWISRVAYGTSHMHRSYARTLSHEMQKLCRGAQL